MQTVPRFAGLVVAASLFVPPAAFAQGGTSKAMDGIREEFAAVKASVLKAATKAPESLLTFQATPDVYSFRKMLLHIADASYSICSGFKGTPGERPKVDDDAPLAKAEVMTVLNGSFTYCDEALAGATDATLAEDVKTGSGATRVKSYYASHLLAHTSLHYGNIVTYMRLNKLSPGN